MPIYEYYCDDCDKSHEVTQRITDDPLEKCPVCGSEKIRKLVSLSSFHLKGTGWYVTDYKGKNPGNGNGKDASHSEESTKSDSEKTSDSTDTSSSKETKPDSTAKSETKSTDSAGNSSV